MATKSKDDNKVESLLSKILNGIESIKGKKAAQALLMQDVNGTEINFPDVADDETPGVGDTAMIDGTAAEGEYVMPSGDTYVFDSGSLSEIKTESEEEDDTAEELAAAQEELIVANAKIVDLEKENKRILKTVNSLEVQVNALMELSGEFEAPTKNRKTTISKQTSKSRSLFKQDKD